MEDRISVLEFEMSIAAKIEAKSPQIRHEIACVFTRSINNRY